VTRDDDLDYTILNLMLLERHGTGFTTEDVGRLWLELLPFGKTFTAEAAAYRNLTEGLAPPETATRLNPYREWVGALIRADVFGFVNPGRPRAAALLAARDARLSHTRNGIYGEMWAAAAVASSFSAESPSRIIEDAQRFVPPRSRLRLTVDRIVTLHGQGASWSDAIAWIESLGYYYVHVINNAAIIAAALLWSEGDFTRGVSLAACAGLDTDSNAATVGSILGVYNGAEAIPRSWSEPLNNDLRTALCGQTSLSIEDAASRTLSLI
jgi:ADP-ribosylglycohydrolase